MVIVLSISFMIFFFLFLVSFHITCLHKTHLFLLDTVAFWTESVFKN